jgi:hypothetical protein
MNDQFVMRKIGARSNQMPAGLSNPDPMVRIGAASGRACLANVADRRAAAF